MSIEGKLLAKVGRTPLNVDAALELALRELPRHDPAVIAGKARVDYEAESGRFSVPYFCEWYAVRFPDGGIAPDGLSVDREACKAVPRITQLLLLHYLLKASGTDLTGRWVSYRELPQGGAYERAFHRRAIEPITSAFGYSLQAFLEAGRAAGGDQTRLADGSFYFRVLPRLPLLCTLWLGDEEVPPGANILYDAASGAYLPSEDLAYLGIALTSRLLGAKRGALLA